MDRLRCLSLRHVGVVPPGQDGRPQEVRPLFAVQLVRSGLRRRSIVLGAAAVMAVVLSGTAVALAQDTSPSPQAVASSTAEDTDGPVFPDTLAGNDLEVLTYSGPEWLAEFQDDTPESAEFAAETRGPSGVVRQGTRGPVRHIGAQPAERGQSGRHPGAPGRWGGSAGLRRRRRWPPAR